MNILTPPTYAEALSFSSNSTTTWAQKVSISLAINKTYMVAFYAEFDVNQGSRPAEVKLEHNDTTIWYNAKVPGGTVSVTQYNVFSGTFILETDATASPHLDLDYKMITTFGSDTISIGRAHITAFEVEV